MLLTLFLVIQVSNEGFEWLILLIFCTLTLWACCFRCRPMEGGGVGAGGDPNTPGAGLYSI